MQQNETNQVYILLSVWGEEYIHDFFNMSLPSLLASGNIPALVQKYKTTFLMLTRESNVEFFENHVSMRQLKKYCDVKYLFIDDLIVIGNYSTTLTLAYDRAMRQTGEQMLNTYFIFLVADYIMAKGSLEGLMRYMQKGYSGICAGNFQVIREDIEPYLLSKKDTHTQIIPIGPRELLNQAIPHLHAISSASFIGQSLIHNYHANRLFFSLDQEVMAGRFYLLHMLCIKPERLNYKIGSSCDYSFIAELCPSENVAIIDDSDDYFVIEIQSRMHELNFLSSGAYDIKKLAYYLAGWTTALHRKNVKHSIYYHSRDLTQNDKLLIENEFNEFMSGLDKNLQSYPVKPYYNHPYWKGAMKSFYAHRKAILGIQEWDDIELSLLNYQNNFPQKLFYWFFGCPPEVSRWHYRWYDCTTVVSAIREAVQSINKNKCLVLYDAKSYNYMRYNRWMRTALQLERQYSFDDLSGGDFQQLQSLLSERFDRCIFFSSSHKFDKLRNNLSLVRKMLNLNGRILLIVSNLSNKCPSWIDGFNTNFSLNMSYLVHSSDKLVNVLPVYNNVAIYTMMTIETINYYFSENNKIRILWYALLGLPGILYIFIRNCLKSLKKKHKSQGHCINILLTLEVHS